MLTRAASLACFLVAFELLAFQLSSGNDPALGATPVAAGTAKRPVVINRRVVQTRVVHLPPKAGTVTASPNGGGPRLPRRRRHRPPRLRARGLRARGLRAGAGSGAGSRAGSGADRDEHLMSGCDVSFRAWARTSG